MKSSRKPRGLSEVPPEQSPKPLKPVHFQILRVLLDGELHGYGIAKQIDERTDGAIRMEPGNLYRFIRRLVDDGLVQRSPNSTTSAMSGTSTDSASRREGRRRRAYRITPQGRTALAQDVSRMRAMVRDAELALAQRRGEP